jgi:hypothetical protein
MRTSSQRTCLGVFLGGCGSRTDVESNGGSNHTTDYKAVSSTHRIPHDYAASFAYILPHASTDSQTVRAPKRFSIMDALCTPIDTVSIHTAAVD